MNINLPSRLSDTELVTELERLARCEREATAQLVAHLAELDARRLYLGAGFSSLFTYCREVLKLSEQSSYNRIEAARAVRRFPVILDMLANAALNLATVRLLAPHLDPDNQRRLLAEAAHKSKREVEELVARNFPQPDVPGSIRKLPVPKAAATSATAESPANALATCAPAAPVIPTTVESSMAAAFPHGLRPPIQVHPVRQPAIRPLAEDRYEIRFTARASTCEKLKLAQDLLRQVVPTGDTAEIVDRALTALLKDLATRKFAATERPRAGAGAVNGSRNIPASVKRAAWLRDGGRCAYTGTAGRRCTASGFLEFHHVVPFAVGGGATVENIQLRCRAHNAYEAELYFGPHRFKGGIVRESGARYGYRPPRLAPGQVGVAHSPQHSPDLCSASVRKAALSHPECT
jgi:hypothetical protein